jgi:hypothetical protein
MTAEAAFTMLFSISCLCMLEKRLGISTHVIQGSLYTFSQLVHYLLQPCV